MRKALRLPGVGWGRGPDGAGHAVNPLRPAQPLAAVRGRLRGMPRKQSALTLGARPRHPCRGRSCPARPPLPSHHPASAVGWLLEARAEAVRTNGPHPPGGGGRFRSHEPPLLTPLSGGPAAPAGICRRGEVAGRAGPSTAWMPWPSLQGRTCGVSCPACHFSRSAATRRGRTPDEPSQQDDPPPVGYDARPRSGRCTQ